MAACSLNYHVRADMCCSLARDAEGELLVWDLQQRRPVAERRCVPMYSCNCMMLFKLWLHSNARQRCMQAAQRRGRHPCAASAR